MLDLRCWENRYTPADADKPPDCRVQNNRLRTQRVQRRCRRITAPDAYQAPPAIVPEPPMFRSSSEASSRARQTRAARRLGDEGPAPPPPVSTACSSDAPAADPANGDAPAADQERRQTGTTLAWTMMASTRKSSSESVSLRATSLLASRVMTLRNWKMWWRFCTVTYEASRRP